MTEYNYSPSAVQRYQDTQGRILTWRSEIAPPSVAPSPKQTTRPQHRRSHTTHTALEHQHPHLDPPPAYSSSIDKPSPKRSRTHHGHGSRRHRDPSPSHSSDTARPDSRRSHSHHSRRRPRSHSRSYTYNAQTYPVAPVPTHFRSQTMPVTVTDGRQIFWHSGMPSQQCVWIPPHGQKVSPQATITYPNNRTTSPITPLTRLKRFIKILTGHKEAKGRSRSPSSSRTGSSRGPTRDERIRGLSRDDRPTRDDKGWLLVETVPAPPNLTQYPHWNSHTGSASRPKLRKYSH